MTHENLQMYIMKVKMTEITANGNKTWGKTRGEKTQYKKKQSGKYKCTKTNS